MLSLLEATMKTNMGLVDRIVRAALAVVVLILYLAGQITGVADVVLGILAVVFLATSVVAFCPLYLPLGISTKKKE
jgi:hypothetical protein